MQNSPVTIVDVANRAGVSIATVSRVLSGGSASAASRQKVEEAIQALGYRPSAPHKKAEKEVGRSLALVISDLTNPYYAALCSGAEEAARRAGWSLLIFQTNLTGWLDDSVAEKVAALPVMGAVIVGSLIESGSAEEIAHRLSIISARLPIVTIGPRIEGISCVNITSDLSLSVRKSISHLVVLGHRRISFIGGTGGIRSSSARRRAYYEEMQRLSLPADQAHISDTGYTPQAGEICVNRLLSSLPRQEWPTALIAINDLVALGALRQLQRLGLKVPVDMALIGCDNQFFSPYLCPPLTTVDLHPYDHGVSAVEELISTLSGGGGGSYSQIRECSLIVRESCGALLGVRSFPDP